MTQIDYSLFLIKIRKSESKRPLNSLSIAVLKKALRPQQLPLLLSLKMPLHLWTNRVRKSAAAAQAQSKARVRTVNHDRQILVLLKLHVKMLQWRNLIFTMSMWILWAALLPTENLIKSQAIMVLWSEILNILVKQQVRMLKPVVRQSQSDIWMHRTWPFSTPQSSKQNTQDPNPESARKSRE